MRPGQVLLHQVASATLVHLLLAADDADASSTTGASRLHDIHVAVVGELALIAPTLPVLGQDVRRRAHLELLAEACALPCHVAPQVTLVTYGPGAGEVINALERVHGLETAGPDEARPQTIPLAALLHDTEARDLERIHNAIVRVRRVIDFECELTARSQVVLR